MKRPPVVVIMGHVDHGKTTLLDYIRKTNVAAKEAGKITQSIGAYEIRHANEKITFIDTPGHEAFFKMRARGTKAADITLLLVAADEGVKNQTREAYQIIKESKTPFVVVINKIDKANADVNRVKAELAQEGILLEGTGGNVSWQEISAKTGQGVDKLLDLILLAADVEGLIYDPDQPASGLVLESRLDRQRGVVVSLVIKNGILKAGDEIVAGSTQAKIRSLENFLGKKIDQAEPSAPVLVTGFSQVPEIGVEFAVGGKIVAEKTTRPQTPLKDEKDVINLILAANDSGSLEALAGVVGNLSLPDGHRLNIIDQSVGDISDGNVNLAIATNAVIVGFKVKVNKTAENLARNHSEKKPVKIVTSDIIYKLVKDLEEYLAKFGGAAIIGDLEILAVFGKRSGKQIVGGRVVAGVVRNNSEGLIIRGGKELAKAKIFNLQKNKQDVNNVEAGSESGLLINSAAEIKPGDHLIINENFSSPAA